MTQPRKTTAAKKPATRPAKKAPAKKAAAKKAATTARAPRRARQRAAGRPGPLPLVLQGFNRATLSWSRGSKPHVVLRALRAGATWELAARVARLHQATPREWNTRGAEVLAQLPTEGADLDPKTPDETVAYLVFHLDAEAAKVGSVMTALHTIARASRQGNVTAATEVLKRHPDAKPYRPDPRLELTGPEGGPIPISVRDEAKAKLEQMAQRLNDNEAATAPTPAPEGETPPT